MFFNIPAHKSEKCEGEMLSNPRECIKDYPLSTVCMLAYSTIPGSAKRITLCQLSGSRSPASSP
jgi:hypothetical protein